MRRWVFAQIHFPKVLEDGKRQTIGKYSYEFSADQLIGGLYFVVLKTEEQVVIKKMILLK